MRLGLTFYADNFWEWAMMNGPSLLTWLFLIMFVTLVITGQSIWWRIVGASLFIGAIGMIGAQSDWTWLDPRAWGMMTAIAFVAALISWIMIAVTSNRVR